MLEQLKKNFLNFHEAIYIVDKHRKILYYNPVAEEISGFSKEEMVGSHCWDNKLNHIDETVADTILNSLEENDLAFRYGGDELLVMFHKVTEDSLKEKARLLQILIKATKIRDIDDDKLTETSMGLTIMFDHAKLKDAIDLADQAMYIAKKSGKNKIQYLHMKQFENKL